jgi:hypothetical protein
LILREYSLTLKECLLTLQECSKTPGKLPSIVTERTAVHSVSVPASVPPEPPRRLPPGNRAFRVS